MKLYLSETDEQFEEITSRFATVSHMEESDQVLILPGGLGSLTDLLQALDESREIMVYNRDNYYSSILKRIYHSYQESKKDDTSFLSMDIEKDLNEIIRKLEEKENGKINNGKNSQLL